jgi:hypothetical protein
MVISPTRVSQFFEVSRQFVNTQLERLGWDLPELSPEDWSGALSTFRIGIIPDDFPTQRGVQVRIHKPVEILIHEEAAAVQDSRASDTRSDEEEDPLENLAAGECEDHTLRHTALSLTEDPELEECEVTLATAITEIECVLVNPPPGLTADVSEPSAPLDPRIPRLQASLRLLRAQMRKITANRNALQRELAQTWRLVHRKERELARVTALIPGQQTPETEQANPEADQAHRETDGASPGSDRPDQPPLEVRLLSEMSANIGVPANERQYSQGMKSVCYILYSLSAQAYRVAHHAFRVLPSATTLANFIREKKLATALALTGGEHLETYLQGYRTRQELTEDAVLPCVLAFDATPVTATGVVLDPKRKSQTSCFAFICLPLDHRFPHMLVRSEQRPTGKINPAVLQVKDTLCAALEANQFRCHFLATNGDSGMNDLHNVAFEGYRKSTGSLPEIVNALAGGQEHGLVQWPIPDLFHLEKNARAKLAMGLLALHGESAKCIDGKSVAECLSDPRMKKVLCACSGLDLLKDDFALETFTLENLVELWFGGNPTAAWFMLPFVSLNQAVRNSRISVLTRLTLIGVAFSVFFDAFKKYPKTGKKAKIYIKGRRGTKKTFWSYMQLKRGCNLCVGLYWAIETWGETQWGFCLALSRIGSHSCECHFGLTRSTLNGDPRWERFLAAQVTAALIDRLMWQLGLSPYVRRFKNAAGYTLRGDEPPEIDIDFGLTLDLLGEAFELLFQDREADAPATDVLVPYVALCEELGRIHYVDKIEESGQLAGHGITTRFKVLRGAGNVPVCALEANELD